MGTGKGGVEAENSEVVDRSKGGGGEGRGVPVGALGATEGFW